jgi:hypothetical protein
MKTSALYLINLLSSFFFFVVVGLGFELGSHTCYASTLLLESLCQLCLINLKQINQSCFRKICLNSRVQRGLVERN